MPLTCPPHCCASPNPDPHRERDPDRAGREEEGLVVGMRGRRRGTEREGTPCSLVRGDRACVEGAREGRVPREGQDVVPLREWRGRAKREQALSMRRFEPRGKRRSKSKAWHRGEQRDE